MLVMLEKFIENDWLGGFMNVVWFWSTEYFKICEYFILLDHYHKYYLWRISRLFDIQIVEKSMRSRAQFWLVDIKFVDYSMTIEARFWLVDIENDKKFSL